MPLLSATSTTVASTFDIEIEKGADVDVELTLVNPDGTIFVLTGYTAKMQVREYVDATVKLLDWSSASGDIVIDQPNGKVTLKFRDNTFDGTWTNGVYDLWIVSPTGKDIPITEGEFRVKKMVTR